MPSLHLFCHIDFLALDPFSLVSLLLVLVCITIVLYDLLTTSAVASLTCIPLYQAATLGVSPIFIIDVSTYIIPTIIGFVCFIKVPGMYNQNRTQITGWSTIY